MQLYFGTWLILGHTKDHYKEAHPALTAPDYVTQQAKFEQLSEAGAQDGQLEAMTVASDVSDMTSSLVDFDEDDEELDAERMKRATAAATPSPAQTPTPVPTPIAAPSLPPSPAASLQLHADALLSCAVGGGGGVSDDVAPEYLTKINPERDNYNVDRITGCWKCGQQFDSRKMLLRHLKDHNIDYSYKCYLCDASFESRAVCLRHTQDAHRHDWVLLRDKNKCHDIDGYSSGIEAQVHETLANLGLATEHADELTAVARSDVSDDKGNLDSDYAQRKVFCSFCVKRFWSLQDLRRHMRSHTGTSLDVHVLDGRTCTCTYIIVYTCRVKKYSF